MKNFHILLLIGSLLGSCGSKESVSGDDLFEKGNYQAAINSYTEYLAGHPDHTKSIYNRGRAFEELGDVKKAKSDFEQVIELDAKHVNAYLSLAKLAYNDHNYNKVLVYAGEAIELNSESAQAYFLSARGAHQLGFFDQAMESYSNAIRINKDFGEAYLYRGALKVGMEKSRSACEDFKLAKLLGVKEAEKATQTYCK